MIEAGGDPNFVTDIPAFLFSTQGSQSDWKYQNEKSDEACLGMVNQRCLFPRGKVLGGCSSINAMLYVRGNADDYDEWTRLGNPGWNYEEVLKRFKKSEKLTGFSLIGDDKYDQLKGTRQKLKGSSAELWDLSKSVSEKYHSNDGFLSVEHYGHDHALSQFKGLLFDSVEELGVPYVPDVNGKNQIGFTQLPGTLVKGTRANTAKMFLSPVKDRRNLHVIKNAEVQKLIIQDKKVTGVEFVRSKQVRTVSVKNEVILSAGTINSPKLLMLSGIGPKEHLESVGVPVIHELDGVGKNLQDHVLFLGAPMSINKSRAKPVPPLAQLDAMYEFLTRGTGLLSTIGMTDVTGFINTKNESNIPDIQYHFIFTPIKDSYLINEVMRAINYEPKLRDQYLNVVKDSDLFIMCPTLLRPESRGRIELKTSDPKDSPKIITNFLTESRDIETLIRGIRFVLKLKETQHFQYLEPELVKLNVPKCNKLEYDSDEYWECIIRHTSVSLYHPVGTCKMGPSKDPSAVVDHSLKVHGIEGLRVADASIMPVIVRGNTNAPTIMVGEMVSDLIKTDWKATKHSEL